MRQTRSLVGSVLVIGSWLLADCSADPAPSAGAPGPGGGAGGATSAAAAGSSVAAVGDATSSAGASSAIGSSSGGPGMTASSEGGAGDAANASTAAGGSGQGSSSMEDAIAPSPDGGAADATAGRPDTSAPADGGDASSSVPAGPGSYPQEIAFTSTANKPNPYMDVSDFTVTFHGPGGIAITVPGFYAGNQIWKVRFAPPVAGTYTYTTSSTQDPSLGGHAGSVPAAPANPATHGLLRVDPSLPHHYVYADGTRYFQMGYEVDWLGLLDLGDPNITKAKTLIDMIASNGFTEVNLQVYGYDTGWKPGITSAYDFGPPTQFPWAGTNAAPDNTRMNEAFWQNYDRVIGYLFAKGLNAHIFCKFAWTYGKNMLVSWPAKGSPEDDMYFRFLLARYQAYPNVIWDEMKESYQEPDQVYIADRLSFIKAHDAYHHLRTLHDSDGGRGQYSPNYYDAPAHAGTVDFYTDQQNNQYATASGAWKKRAMPYLNAETTMYQIGNDGTWAYKGDPKEAVFQANMEVVMGGGYFTYYYSLQAWDIVRWNETPNGVGWYKNLAAFMKTTGWYAMAPSDALVGGGAVGTHCLANPGKEYIVYDRGGGTVTLDIAGAAGALAATWVDLYTGTRAPAPASANGSHAFPNPWPDPAVLHVGP